jgi:hypothetical protein
MRLTELVPTTTEPYCGVDSAELSLRLIDDRSRKSAILLLSLSLCCGCAETKDLVSVSGKVTFDGSPIDSGVITFFPVDSKEAGRPGKFAARIHTGTFNVELPRGPAIVSIEGYRSGAAGAGTPTKTQGPNDLSIKTAQYIPEKFNAESRVKYTVDGPDSAADFQLE